MPHDEVLAHNTDRSGVSDPLRGDALKKSAVFHCGNLGRILLRGVPEDENRGSALQGAQDGPVGLARVWRMRPLMTLCSFVADGGCGILQPLR